MDIQKDAPVRSTCLIELDEGYEPIAAGTEGVVISRATWGKDKGWRCLFQGHPSPVFVFEDEVRPVAD